MLSGCRCDLPILMILENEKKKEKEYNYHIFEHRHGAEGSSSSGARDSSSHNIRNFQHEMLVKGYHLPLNLTAHIGVSAHCAETTIPVR